MIVLSTTNDGAITLPLMITDHDRDNMTSSSGSDKPRIRFGASQE
jgi:hypothetical protein